MVEKILVVEDDLPLREALCETIKLANFDVTPVESAEKALKELDKISFSLVVTDVNLPEKDGITLLKTIKQRFPVLPVIIITAYGSIPSAVTTIKNGAVDYILKPFESKQLIEKIQHYYLKYNENDLEKPVAEDPLSKSLFEMALRLAVSDITIMITGESGCGKEVLARYIHENSSRKNEPFVAINCAAIPDNMLEAILFGYEKGAFTGAYASQAGKFEQAQDGTIFLDEITEMSLALQAKLLRILQEKKVERLGGKKVIDLDVRIIATSNRDLKEAVQQGVFREDLYYRLNVFPLHWMPLRERPKDIIPLAEYLLAKHSLQMKLAVPKFTDSVKEKLLEYNWPGNVREMENVIQRAIILQNSGLVDESVLQIESINFSKKINSRLKTHQKIG